MGWGAGWERAMEGWKGSMLSFPYNQQTSGGSSSSSRQVVDCLSLEPLKSVIRSVVS